MLVDVVGCLATEIIKIITHGLVSWIVVVLFIHTRLPIICVKCTALIVTIQIKETAKLLLKIISCISILLIARTELTMAMLLLFRFRLLRMVVLPIIRWLVIVRPRLSPTLILLWIIYITIINFHH